jgi:hypothetical protein
MAAVVVRVRLEGKITDSRTAKMHAEAERLGGNLVITQGSYSGSVGASAGTHLKGGALDYSVNGLTTSQINKRVKALRTVGFAAWYRPPIPGVWGPHIHAIARGCPDLPDIALRQIASYIAGRDGLAGNGLDRHRGLGVAPTTWEKYLADKEKPPVDLSWVIERVKKHGDYTGRVAAGLRKRKLTADRKGYAAFQKSKEGGSYTGSNADGVAGSKSLTAMGKADGWKVKA